MEMGTLVIHTLCIVMIMDFVLNRECPSEFWSPHSKTEPLLRVCFLLTRISLIGYLVGYSAS